MLWYLLYPFRGTTSAPSLGPDHPLRRFLTRYGTFVARHVATTLVIFVALSATLLYPIPFLYTNDYASGASNLPLHVWTNAKPIKGDLAVDPDVIMRSIWVHGSYMKALDRDVLLGALELQDYLLGPTNGFGPWQPSSAVVDDRDVRLDHRDHLDHLDHLENHGPLKDLTVAERDAFHVVNGLTNQSWFFHSPLLYWLSDRDAIANDTNILGTVNEHKKQHTSVNVTLRHSVVFSGKRFQDRALVAADALVITLIHLRDSPVGRQWERKAAELAARPNDKWDVYLKNPHSPSSQLFEFQFLPISLQDTIMLVVAYGITFVYVVHNLSKLPAIKSRPGLILTVVAQIFVSIMSSFTVCAVLKIDLSHIPRAAYPIVIVSMSLENMLRLIKAVIATNLQDSTSSRIGAAFGKTTHVAFASVLEHMMLLWVISSLVTSALSAFCAFLAIAIVFDFVYLSTFFLAVLSCEVRRSELSEMLEKSSSARRNKRTYSDPTVYPYASYHYQSLHMPPRPAPPRPSWAAAMLQGRVNTSTRIAGTMILLGFVAIAQWHFFDNESILQTLRRLFVPTASGSSNGGGGGGGSAGNNLTTWNSGSALHQARSPTSWLRMQDHETAQEVISVVKPWAHSYVARVYEPLVFVLKGSDRMPSVTERPFLPAVYDFVHHQWQPFIMTIVVLTAAMRIFVNYLLWDEMGAVDGGGSGGSSGGGDDGPDSAASRLTVRTLDRGHALDVALLAASPDGLVVSVGLDRWIRVWNVPFGGMNYLVPSQDAPFDVPFPVLALAIDADATWLAILSSYQVALWNVEAKHWGPSIAVDLCGQKPEAFFFTPHQKQYLCSLVVVRRNGMLTELWADTGESVESPICKSPVVCAVPLHLPQHSSAAFPGGALAMITASRNGCIHRVTAVGGDAWMSEEIKHQSQRHDGHAASLSLVAMPPLSAFLVVRQSSVDLVDLATSQTLHTFVPASPIKARSLRYLYAARRGSPRAAPELSYFSLIYTSATTGHCVIQTYLPQDEDGSIAFVPDDVMLTRRQPGLPNTAHGAGCSWYEARQVVREVENPGVWEALPNGCVIGVRQTDRASSPDQGTPNKGGSAATGVEGVGNGLGGFRRRGRNVSTHQTPQTAHPSDANKAHHQPKASIDNIDGPWEAWAICSVADHSSAGSDDGDQGADSSDVPAAGKTAPDNNSNSSSSNNNNNKNYVTRRLSVDQGELLATEAGPLVCVGAGTVALGLGAAIKIITVGHERFGSAADMLEAAAGQLMASSPGNRRRKNRSLQKHY